jgi:DNA-binding response OmpR family regulator
MPDTPTILLVEDNPSDVMFIRVALKQAGITHTLQIVGDGERAIQYLAGEKEYANRDLHPIPRLVLLDLGLPVKSGFEVLEWITRHAGPVNYSVVILSSSSKPEDIVCARSLGAKSFLTKPESFESLVEIVMSVREYLDDSPLPSASFAPGA